MAEELTGDEIKLTQNSFNGNHILVHLIREQNYVYQLIIFIYHCCEEKYHSKMSIAVIFLFRSYNLLLLLNFI